MIGTNLIGCHKLPPYLFTCQNFFGTDPHGRIQDFNIVGDGSGAPVEYMNCNLCFVYPIFSSFGFWYFGHFVSWFSFRFFPSCPSCLAKCKQILSKIFVYFCNFVAKSDQKRKMRWTKHFWILSFKTFSEVRWEKKLVFNGKEPRIMYRKHFWGIWRSRWLRLIRFVVWWLFNV